MLFQKADIIVDEATGASTLVLRLIEKPDEEDKPKRQTKPKEFGTREKILIALASTEIKEGDNETAPKLSVRAMTELIGMSKTAVQKAGDGLKAEGLLDADKRLTPKGLEAALKLEAQARELGQDEDETD
jgi:DNA-binding transcriptional ArsR family regulator